MSKDRTPDKTRSETPTTLRPEVAAFLDKVKSLSPATATGGRGRLIFALDATMSRQPTWDHACILQADMFREAAASGGLDIQLVYFRGLNECRASEWVAQSDKLASLMSKIHCEGGHTQIGRVLSHAEAEHDRQRVQALVYIGDAMEESVDALCAKAGELGLRGMPVFMFQEGNDPDAERAYREIARLSRGAYCRFDSGAANELRELLRAVAAYAAGGLKALASLSEQRGRAAQQLLAQLK